MADSIVSRLRGGAWASRRGKLPAEFWAFAGAAIVLVCARYLGARIGGSVATVGDERAYIRYAHNLTHGTYAIASQGPHGLYLWKGPGLPLVLTPLVALHASVNVLRLVGPVSLLVAGVFFWLFLRNFVTRWVALAAGGALAVFPPFLPLMPHIRSEPVALMFLMAALWALGKAHRSGRKRWALASGILAGLMVLTRVEDGYILLAGLLVCLVVYAVRRKRTDLLNLICVSAALAVCLPWLAYTESLTHKFPYWASSGGMSLYLMASPTAGNTGSWVNPENVKTDPHWLPDHPLFQRLNDVQQVQADSQLQTVALRLIRQHPGVYLEHVADNLSRMVIGTPYSFESAGKGVYFYGIADVILLIALAVAVVVIRRGRSAALPSALRVLAIFAVLNFALHLAVAAYPRMTTLSIPAALAVVALGLEQLVRGPQRGHRAVAAPESV